MALGGETPSNVMRTIEALLEYYAGAQEHDKLKSPWRQLGYSERHIDTLPTILTSGG
jgi:hypothetical protein